MSETFTAVVANSVITDPSIRVTDEDGFVLKYLDLAGRSFTPEQLTERLVEADFVVTGPWRVHVRPDGALTVEATVRQD